jgi:hypothetical protein
MSANNTDQKTFNKQFALLRSESHQKTANFHLKETAQHAPIGRGLAFSLSRRFAVPLVRGVESAPLVFW